MGGGQSTAVTTIALVATVTNSAGSAMATTTGFSTVFSALTGSALSAASANSVSLSSVKSGLAASASSAAASAA